MYNQWRTRPLNNENDSRTIGDDAGYGNDVGVSDDFTGDIGTNAQDSGGDYRSFSACMCVSITERPAIEEV